MIDKVIFSTGDGLEKVEEKIRYELDLEKEELEKELIIIDYLKLKYPIILNEEVNTGMSGDVNRVVITKGKLTE